MKTKKQTNIELTRGDILEAVFQYLEHMTGEDFSDADATLVMNEFIILNLTEKKDSIEAVVAVFSTKEE